MNIETKPQTIRFFPLLVLAMLVNILAQAVHETGHHMVYQVMGHEPVWAFTKIVQLGDTPPRNPADWTKITNSDGTTNWLKMSSPLSSNVEEAISAAAGPLAGLLSAILGLVILGRTRETTSKQIFLAFTLTISLAALLYYIRSPMRTGGDEYDIAFQLSIHKSIIEIPLVLAYSACMILGLRILPTWRKRFRWLGILLLGSIATGLPMAMFDPILIEQIDTGNPWFQPIFGYSLPVFITIILAIIGIWLWPRWQSRHFKNSNFL